MCERISNGNKQIFSNIKEIIIILLTIMIKLSNALSKRDIYSIYTFTCVCIYINPAGSI